MSNRSPSFTMGNPNRQLCLTECELGLIFAASYCHTLSQQRLVELRQRNKQLRDGLGKAQKAARDEQRREQSGRDSDKLSSQLVQKRTEFD